MQVTLEINGKPVVIESIEELNALLSSTRISENGSLIQK